MFMRRHIDRGWWGHIHSTWQFNEATGTVAGPGPWAYADMAHGSLVGRWHAAWGDYTAAARDLETQRAAITAWHATNPGRVHPLQHRLWQAECTLDVIEYELSGVKIEGPAADAIAGGLEYIVAAWGAAATAGGCGVAPRRSLPLMRSLTARVDAYDALSDAARDACKRRRGTR